TTRTSRTPGVSRTTGTGRMNGRRLTHGLLCSWAASPARGFPGVGCRDGRRRCPSSRQPVSVMIASVSTSGRLPRKGSARALTTDILIIGGGVIGTSMAYYLASRRVGRVLLLEKAYLGAGSSGKSGAIVRQHYSNRLTASMAQKSLRVFEHFEDVVAGPPVFTRTGMAIVVNERDRQGLETNLALQRELGVELS